MTCLPLALVVPWMWASASPVATFQVAPTSAVPASLVLTWAGHAADGRTHLELQMTPFVSYEQWGAPVTTVGSVKGTLMVGAEEWGISQANFGEMFGQAHYTPEGNRGTFLLPVLFSRTGGDTTANGLIVVPCGVSADRLGCEPPRLGFSEMVERCLPTQPRAGEILPGLR